MNINDIIVIDTVDGFYQIKQFTKEKVSWSKKLLPMIECEKVLDDNGHIVNTNKIECVHEDFCNLVTVDKLESIEKTEIKDIRRKYDRIIKFLIERNDV